MKIAIDAFGGDNAPLEIIKGAALAVQEYNLEIALAGSETEIRRVAQENGVSLEGMTIFDAPEVVIRSIETTQRGHELFDRTKETNGVVYYGLKN